VVDRTGALEVLGMNAPRKRAARVKGQEAGSGNQGAPLISVIMNCFNGERYLREAVESVRAQSYSNWELVFWDNQSTDRSLETVLSFKDERLRCFRAPQHTPLGEARNRAIQKARGEFLAFLDVDDWWMADKLAKQVRLFADPEVGMVCGDFWILDETRGKTWKWLGRKVPTGWVLDDLLQFYFVGLLSLVVRRSAFDSLSYGCDPRYVIIEDLDLVVRLAVAWKLECVQAPVGYYRLHGNNESIRRRGLQVAEMENWLREMEGVPAISRCPGFRRAVDMTVYLKAAEHILRGDKKGAWPLMGRLPFGVLLLRAMIGLVIPHGMLSRLKGEAHWRQSAS
jgi:GT2 family glycosyltransferase